MKLFGKKTENTNVENKVKTKKKFKARYVVIPVLGIAIVGVVVSSVVSANSPTPIECVNPYNEDVVKTIEISGTISADETKVFFAPADGQLSTVNVEAGDTVSAGDVLYAYNEEEIDKNIQLVQYKLSASENTYLNSVEKNDDNTAKNAEAVKNIDGITARIKELKKEQDRLSNDIAYRTASIDPADAATDGVLGDLNAKLKDVQVNIAGYEEMLAENKTKKATTEAAALTNRELATLSANRSMESLSDKDSIEDLKGVKGGIVSDISGIVLDVKAVDGMSIPKGTEVCSIANTEKLYVSVNLSKTDSANVKEGNNVDITFGSSKYSGVVEKISKVATRNESGSTVVKAKIAFSNPDDQLILGSEAKVKIYVDEQKDALVIPNECIGYGAEGPLVYVVEDGVLTTKNIEIGINNDFVSVVKSGLTAEDFVVTEDTSVLVEGINATAVTPAE